MKKPFLALAAIISLFTISCKKEDAQTPVTKENVSGTYKIGSVKARYNGGPEIDITSSFGDPCEMDDMYTLKVDGTYDIIDAGTKCNPATDDTGTWELPNNSTIVLEGEAYSVDSFNGHQLVISQTETSNGTTSTIITSYNKQ